MKRTAIPIAVLFVLWMLRSITQAQDGTAAGAVPYYGPTAPAAGAMTGAPAVAPQTGSIQALPVRSRGNKSIVSVGGRRTVLMWAIGLDDPADIEQYKASGLNTAYVRITDLSSARIASASRLASAAEEAGLMVVFSLAPVSLQNESGATVAINPVSDGYADAVKAFVKATADGVGEHPRLVAWVVEVRPGDVVTDDNSFISYLRNWYSTLAALNYSWGTDYGDWSDISGQSVRDVDSGYAKGIGRATLDYAYYRQSAYADALSPWATALRAADPTRMIFAGSLTDYRSAISVPTGFDGEVLSVYPSVTENDWYSHNVHAVDIARRAGQFAAVQMLETTAGTSADQLTHWAGMALVHGASGIAFSSWSALREDENLRGAIAQIQDTTRKQGYPEEPWAMAAIIYEPFAGGAQNRYGYIDGFAPGTPTNLFAVARNGSRYGLFDVLGADDVATTDLSQYHTIIAPMAFFLSTDAQVALQNWALRGGGLVVDQGVAMYQADGVVTSMPAVMREILGMRYEDLAIVQGRQPMVEQGETYNPAEPTKVRPLAPGQQGKDVDPALTRFIQQIQDFATRADVAQYLGDSFAGEAGTGFRVRGLGEGFAAYYPDFLYEGWTASNEYFNEFHNKVLSRNSPIEIVDPDMTWPGVSAALYDDRSVGAASPDGTPLSLLVYGSGNQVYLVPSGMARVSNLDEVNQTELLFPGQPLARAVPLPIYLYPIGEGATASVSVKRYGRDGIELVVAGAGSAANTRGGQVAMTEGNPTQVDLEIRGGAYGMAADSMHAVTVRQGPVALAPRTQQLMPNPDTGSLIVRLTVTYASITVKPAG